jgi:hypothetical protein
MRRYRHGNTGYYVAKLLEETIGTKFSVVIGYPGCADIELAVERGEMQCAPSAYRFILDASPITPGGKKESLASWFKPEQNVSPV